jgi:signal transduction histidine kinase
MRLSTVPAATVASPAGAVSRDDTPTRDPLSAHVLTGATVLLLALMVWLQGDRVGEQIMTSWPWLVFWLALIFLVDLFPVSAGSLWLTLDMPLLLAVAFLYEPAVAASVAFLAATDYREFRRQVSLTRAVFNRAQVALSVLAAGYVFRGLGGELELPAALIPSAGAVMAEHTVNVFMVVLLLHLAEKRPWREILRSLRIGSRLEFLAIYLGYGLLALVLVRLYEDSGAWAVPILIAPLLAARQALDRTKDVEVMKERLTAQNTFVEKTLDRISEERRDERRLVASELHDEVLQCLVRINLLAHAMNRDSQEDLSPEDLLELVDTSGHSMDALRGVIRNLHRSPLGGVGIVQALESLVQRLREEWRAEISVALTVPARELDEIQQVAIYQVAREGLVNALKHAHASNLSISLTCDDSSYFLSVEDDGVGFHPPKTAHRQTHFGLSLIRERIERVGGRLEILSDRHGTRLLATVPRESESEEPRTQS